MRTSVRQEWAQGGTIFAAVMMLVIGLYQIFEGIAAIWQGSFFIITQPGYAYEINTTAFGWIHLVIGVVVLAAGAFLFTGNIWARTIAIVLAGISAISNFFFLPYYPVWSLLIIALDVFVIWALATARGPVLGRDAGERATPGAYAGSDLQSGERWPPENVPGGRTVATDVKEGVRGEQAAREQAARMQAAREQAAGVPPASPPLPPSAGG